MAFPSLARLPAFDAKTFARRLREGVTQPNGDPYAVFGDDGLPRLVGALRGQRDALAETRVYARDVKVDLDRHKEADNDRHAALATRVAALEGQQTSAPFPGSG